MLRHSKDEYHDFSKRPSVLERLTDRLAARAVADVADITDITMTDILEAHDKWQEECPDDPEAIHRLVDERWAAKRQKS
jgi:hypothetical protein